MEIEVVEPDGATAGKDDDGGPAGARLVDPEIILPNDAAGAHGGGQGLQVLA
jgi:hypothetical protein